MDEDRKTFYIGSEVDQATGQPGQPILYPGKDLTTHGIIVGMTGSGKTGLSIDLIEEALMDGVPVIAIDPKGDLGNLLLTFPGLSPAEFQPWVDPAEAERKSLTVEQTAVDTAQTWQKGLAASGIAPERIAQLKASADFVIFTPGSTSGIPVSVLQSFRRPRGDLGDEETQEKVKSVTSALLGLVGIEADPIRSREHILISSIINDTWGKGMDLTLPDLIVQLQNPPFEKLGVFEVNTFFPPKDRLDLAMRINGLIASPSFQSWLNGAPLDIDTFFHAPDGRPRCSIFAIAHLSDAERMFFVTLLLQEVLAWMRLQQGTDSLRALLYFDEVFGYFPPYPFNPPSKVPLLTLMKQARAFGLGVVLATQNPVDIDYKGISNAGTWIIGKLQQEGDRERVMGGLEGALQEGGGSLDREWFTRVLGGLKPRQFLLHNVHTARHVVLQSRFAMSYLRGPLTKAQISLLMAPRKSEFEHITHEVLPTSGPSRYLPSFPEGIPVLFAGGQTGGALDALVFGEADVVYEDSATSTFMQEHVLLSIPAEAWASGGWEQAGSLPAPSTWSTTAPDGVLFNEVPADLQKPASWKTIVSRFKDALKARPLTLLSSKVYKVAQQDNETEDQFMARLGVLSAPDITAAVNKVQDKLAEKQRKLEEDLTTAQQQLQIAQMDARNSTAAEVAQGAETVLGWLMKRRRSVSAVARSHGTAEKRREKVKDLQAKVAGVQQQLTVMQSQGQAAVVAEEQAARAKFLAVDQKVLRPKVGNIVIQRAGIVFSRR